MNIESEKFINEIFDIESKRILHDIKEYTPLKSVIEGFSEEQKAAALRYIIDVFEECYLVGDLKVYTEVEVQKLKAYAMYFVFRQTKTIYLHFLFVNNEYRGKGVGKSILAKFKDHALDTYLLCDFTKVDYYEHCGFRFMSKANTPLGDNFKMSKYLYHSLSIMTNSESSTQAPIFYLNDSDLRIISGVSEMEFQKLASLEPKI